MNKDPARADKPVAAKNRLRDTSDHSLVTLLTRLGVATDIGEIRLLSEKIEREIFHKQFENV
jgi:hypothetical protein